jgi:type III pantothenate kinase
VTRIRNEVDFPARCVATGGLAELIASETTTIEATDELLTLKGLKILYDRNVGAHATGTATGERPAVEKAHGT